MSAADLAQVSGAVVDAMNAGMALGGLCGVVVGYVLARVVALHRED